MPARERFFDPLLAGEQPVHRAEQLGLVDLAEVELVGERAMREAPGQRQLGARRDQQLADHRDDQVALAAALPADQSLQIEPAQRAQHRGDVPVRQRAFDLEVLIEVDQHPSGEHRPDRLDDGQRQVREVAQVLVADLAALAVGAPQQVGRVLLPALALRLDCGYVSRAATPRHPPQPTCSPGQNPGTTLATPCRQKEARSPQPRAIGPQPLKNFRLAKRDTARRKARNPG